MTVLNGKSNENEFDLRGQDHESVDVFFWIIIFAGAVGSNGGCKEKDQTPLSQTQSAQQKEPGEATDTPGRVAVSAEQAQPLSIGAKVPAVLLKTVDGQTADLADLIEEKPTVMVFYRGGW